MSQVRDQTNWIRLCRRGELSDNQRVLLETVLAASDPKSILTRHAASSQTADDSIARAHAAVKSRARPDRRMSQPFSKPAFALISAALAVFESRKPAFPSGALDTAIRTLREYQQFYNHRPHQGIADARPLQPLPEPITDPAQITRLHIRRHPRLGGILNEYHHAPDLHG